MQSQRYYVRSKAVSFMYYNTFHIGMAKFILKTSKYKATAEVRVP